jgi:hypothetical protein
MFSADLSWTESNVEKVGERRDRKARERSSTAGSIKTSSSSRSSESADRELWWTSGLKKAKGLQSSVLRPSSNRSSSNSQSTTHFVSKKLALKFPQGLKDPTLQPSWTYATTLSPTLPSGAPFDLPVQEVPELEGDRSSRRTTSTEARFSREQPTVIGLEEKKLTIVPDEPQLLPQTPWKVDTIKEENLELADPSSSRRREANSTATDRADAESPSSPYDKRHA